MDNNDPKKSGNLLKYRLSNFQPLKNKRPYENTDNYQNYMKKNRIDPKVFSVYKIVEEPKGPSKYSYTQIYVQDGYVMTGYVEQITT